MIICPWKEILKYAPLLPGIEEAFEKINSLESLEAATYPLENGRFSVSSGTTFPAEGAACEAHRNYLDIQYILKGEEYMGWAPLETLAPTGPFDTEKDIGFFAGKIDYMRIGEGYCYVVFPEDAHSPTKYLDAPSEYVKVVVKLKV